MCKNRIDLPGYHLSGCTDILCLALPPAVLTYYMMDSGADDNHPG